MSSVTDEMIDYEELILERQDEIEIAEDNYGWENTGEEELYFNPILMQIAGKRKWQRGESGRD